MSSSDPRREKAVQRVREATRIKRCVGSSSRGYAFPVVWLYLLLAVVVGIAIWLAIVVIKWLFILAVVAGLIWLLLALRRRLA